MAYKDEISTVVNNKLFDNLWGHKVVMMNGIIIIEGHKGLVAYDSSLMKVRLAKGVMELSGTGMSIVTSNNDEIIIKGSVDKIEVIR